MKSSHSILVMSSAICRSDASRNLLAILANPGESHRSTSAPPPALPGLEKADFPPPPPIDKGNAGELPVPPVPDVLDVRELDFVRLSIEEKAAGEGEFDRWETSLSCRFRAEVLLLVAEEGEKGREFSFEKEWLEWGCRMSVGGRGLVVVNGAAAEAEADAEAVEEMGDSAIESREVVEGVWLIKTV
jgi:hypothetical protein